jgi:serine/threonine-protein kinase RsbW
MNKLEFSISSEIGNIVKVENFIDHFTEFYEVDSMTFGKINLAVIEAVNNAILYGNKMDASKCVRFFVEKCDNKLYVTVEDEGQGFDFDNIPDPTLPGNLEKDAGRGLFLMKTLSDEIMFENGGSKVTLIFHLNESSM